MYTPGTGKWAAILTPSLDHMRLSITTAPDSSDDHVRILGDVGLSDTEQLALAERELLPRQWPADARESDPSADRQVDVGVSGHCNRDEVPHGLA